MSNMHHYLLDAFYTCANLEKCFGYSVVLLRVRAFAILAAFIISGLSCSRHLWKLWTSGLTKQARDQAIQIISATMLSLLETNQLLVNYFLI